MKDLLVVGDIPGFADSLLRGWQAKSGRQPESRTPQSSTLTRSRSPAAWSPGKSRVPVGVASS